MEVVEGGWNGIASSAFPHQRLRILAFLEIIPIWIFLHFHISPKHESLFPIDVYLILRNKQNIMKASHLEILTTTARSHQ